LIMCDRILTLSANLPISQATIQYVWVGSFLAFVESD
jgi:hypothetical protein